MQKVLIALACTTLIGLAGCATPDNAAKSAEVTSSGKAALSEEAKAALGAAQADAKAAKAKNALWTTADAALKAAQKAAEEGDSAAVLKQSAIVRAHVKLGMEQLSYPQIPLSN